MYELHGVRFVTTDEAAALLGHDVKKSTIEKWVSRKHLTPVGKIDGKNLFRWKDVMEVEYRLRSGGRGRPRAEHASLRLTETISADTMSETEQSMHAAQGPRFAPPVPPLDKSVVYYVRFGDRVKIGYSADFQHRLTKLPHDEVLALEPGGRKLETLRHAQFSSHRVKNHAEWFSLHPALDLHIKKLIEMHGTPGEFIKKPAAVPPSHRRARGGAPEGDGVWRQTRMPRWRM